MRKSLMLVALFVFALSVFAQNVEEVQRVLQATNATWTAKESWVTRMSAIEQEKLLGLLPGVMDMAGLNEVMEYCEEVRGSYTCPVTSIKNQGSCGSCYSFGASATYESYCLMKNLGTKDLSEQDFMMKAKATGPYGGCSGWYLDTSMNLLKNKGVTTESCCPYKAYEAACPTTCQPTEKIASWVSTSDLNTIKSYLQKYGPGYCGFAVYADFMSYSGGVYTYKTGDLRGYHAVTIVGFDDATNSFKVKNSWGTGWGESGYFRIAYSELNGKSQFGKCFGGTYFITGK